MIDSLANNYINPSSNYYGIGAFETPMSDVQKNVCDESSMFTKLWKPTMAPKNDTLTLKHAKIIWNTVTCSHTYERYCTGPRHTLWTRKSCPSTLRIQAYQEKIKTYLNKNAKPLNRKQCVEIWDPSLMRWNPGEVTRSQKKVMGSQHGLTTSLRCEFHGPHGFSSPRDRRNLDDYAWCDPPKASKNY